MININFLQFFQMSHIQKHEREEPEIEATSQHLLSQKSSKVRVQNVQVFEEYQNITNTVLLVNIQPVSHCYLPVYFRIVIQSFNDLKLDSHQVTVNMTMLVTVKYEGMNQEWVQRLLEHISTKGLEVIPFQGKPINLTKCLNNDQGISQITLYHTEQAICKIFPDLFWSPFQLLYTYTSFEFPSFEIQMQHVKIKFRINLLNHKNTNEKIRPGPNVWIKDYDLAENLLSIEYANKPYDENIMNNKFDFTKSNIETQKKQNEDRGYVAIDDSDDEKQQKNIKLSERKARILDERKKMFLKIKAKENQKVNLMKSQNNQNIQKQLEQYKNQEEPEQQESQEENQPDIQNQENHINQALLSNNNTKEKKNLDSFTSTAFQDKTINFRFANICIGIYKIPNSAFFNIFLPFLCLGIINLGIFFQNSALADRIAAIATVMLAYVASLPTIRAELPRLNFIFIEYLISIQIFTTILCLIQSLTIKDEGQEFVATWDNGWFISTAVLTGFNIISIVILYLLHFCYWKRIYGQYSNKFKDNVNEFDSNQWKSQECQQAFFNQIVFNQTIPLQYRDKRIIEVLNRGDALSSNFQKFHPNLLEAVRNGKKIIVQQATINKDNFQKWKKQVQNKIFWKKKYLFLPKDIETRNSGWCQSQNLNVSLYYSYFPILLYDVIEARKAVNNYFRQSQLWYLVYALMSQAAGFHQNGVGKLGNIRPQNIFLNQYGNINILCRLSTLSQNKAKVKQYYAPQYESMGKKSRKNRKQLIKFQSFAIGLTCLDAALLEFSSKFYDGQTKKVDLGLLQQSRAKLIKTKRIGELLEQVILGLCDPDPQTRRLFVTIYERAKDQKKSIQRGQFTYA